MNVSLPSLCSAHLRALPDRGLCVRSLHPGGLCGGRVLLPLPPAQTGALVRRRVRRRSRRGSPLGDHPHDGQRGDLQRFIVPPVQHGHVVQLLRPARRASPGSPSPHAGSGLLLPAPWCQRLRQHAHQLLRAQLPAGHADHASPGTVPAPTVHRLRPPCVHHHSLPGPHSGRIQTPPVPLPASHWWVQYHQRPEIPPGDCVMNLADHSATLLSSLTCEGSARDLLGGTLPEWKQKVRLTWRTHGAVEAAGSVCYCVWCVWCVCLFSVSYDLSAGLNELSSANDWCINKFLSRCILEGWTAQMDGEARLKQKSAHVSVFAWVCMREWEKRDLLAYMCLNEWWLDDL